jgi:hypothetical protein
MWNSAKFQNRLTHIVLFLHKVNFVLILAILSAAVWFVAGVGQNEAYACTPPPGGLPEYSASDRAQAAEIVVVGTVLEIENDLNQPSQLSQAVTVEVEQYLKGRGPGIVDIRGYGSTAVCLTPVQVGDHRIFYATGDPDMELVAHYLSQFDAAESASPDTLAEIGAVVNQDPYRPGEVTPTMPVPEAGSQAPSNQANWLPLAGAGGAALLILGLFAFWRYGRRG